MGALERGGDERRVIGCRMNDTAPVVHARAAAATLIDTALAGLDPS